MLKAKDCVFDMEEVNDVPSKVAPREPKLVACANNMGVVDDAPPLAVHYRPRVVCIAGSTVVGSVVVFQDVPKVLNMVSSAERMVDSECAKQMDARDMTAVVDFVPNTVVASGVSMMDATALAAQEAYALITRRSCNFFSFSIHSVTYALYQSSCK